jgi:hypothetical protein
LALPCQHSKIVVWYVAFLFSLEGKAQKADKSNKILDYSRSRVTGKDLMEVTNKELKVFNVHLFLIQVFSLNRVKDASSFHKKL